MVSGDLAFVKPIEDAQRACPPSAMHRLVAQIVLTPTCKRFTDEYSAKLVKNPQGAPPELVGSGRPEYEVNVAALHYLADKAPKKDDHGYHPHRANVEDEDT